MLPKTMDPRNKFRHIKPVNFEEMTSIAEKFRSKSRDIEAKILALSEARQKMKAAQTMSLLARIWREERTAKRTDERDAFASLNDPTYKWIFDEPSIKRLSEEIAKNEEEFQNVVIRPLWTMRTDLKQWIESRQQGSCVPPPEPIKSVITEMRNSLPQIQCSLDSELEQCEMDNSRERSNFSETTSFEEKSLMDWNGATHGLNLKEIGIPEEAWNWPSPSEQFLADMLAEFIQLDSVYFDQFEKYHDEYESFRMQKDDSWKPEEIEMVDYFAEVFKRYESTNRKKLCVELLTRIMKNRSDVEFERLLERRAREKQLRDRLYTVKRSWIKAREDLSIRIRATLLQATEIVEQKRLQTEQKRTQRELCTLLQEQVRRWREQKAEILELEERQRAIMMAREENARKAQKCREEAERRALKDKIAAHKAMKAALKQREDEKEAARLAELKDIHAKQARIDAVRLLEVEKNRLIQVQRKRILAQEDAELEHRKREERLESLREKVRPVINADPERVTSETEAWRLRLEERRQEESEQTHASDDHFQGRHGAPLNTFSDAQLYADRRTRLTAALHAAGLLNSNYARTLLATIQTNHSTRKDNITSEPLKTLFSSHSEAF